MTRQEAATVIERFLDGGGGPYDWDDFTSTRHQDRVVERASRVCVAIGQLHPSDIKGHYSDASGLDLLRTLAAGLRGVSSAAQLRAWDVLASALESDAALQEAGDVRQVGMAAEEVWVQVAAVAPDYGEAVAFAFSFWDEWADAANHDWQYHEPITRSDWPRYARMIAEGLRRNQLPANDRLIEAIRIKPRLTFSKWLSRLFERAV
jgi:hypothetical protein